MKKMCEQKSKSDVWDYVNGDFPSSSVCEKKCPKKIIPSGGDPTSVFFQDPITLSSNTQIVGGQAYETPDGKWELLFSDNFDFVFILRNGTVPPESTGGTLSRLHYGSGWGLYNSQYIVENAGSAKQFGSLILPYLNPSLERNNIVELKNEAKSNTYLMFEVLVSGKPTPPANSTIGATVESSDGTLNMTIGYYDGTILKTELVNIIHT